MDFLKKQPDTMAFSTSEQHGDGMLESFKNNELFSIEITSKYSSVKKKFSSFSANVVDGRKEFLMKEIVIIDQDLREKGEDALENVGEIAQINPLEDIIIIKTSSHSTPKDIEYLQEYYSNIVGISANVLVVPQDFEVDLLKRQQLTPR